VTSRSWTRDRRPSFSASPCPNRVGGFSSIWVAASASAAGEWQRRQRAAHAAP
jgi:hypothetical protein